MKIYKTNFLILKKLFYIQFHNIIITQPHFLYNILRFYMNQFEKLI